MKNQLMNYCQMGAKKTGSSLNKLNWIIVNGDGQSYYFQNTQQTKVH